MTERCPCCNARLKQAVSCPRCRADLTAVIHAEKSAKLFLSQAIQYLIDDKVEQGCVALNRSLCLKKTKSAAVFRDFFIDQQYRIILGLLSQTQVLSAKDRLYHARLLMPYSKKLQQLNNFIDYLLAGNGK
jgi:hypothetical protein